MIDLNTEIDIIFNAIDDMYWDAEGSPEKRKKIDLVLSQVTEDMPLTLLIGFLSITLPHKEEFRYRNRIIEMIERIDPERADRLVSGLR